MSAGRKRYTNHDRRGTWLRFFDIGLCPRITHAQRTATYVESTGHGSKQWPPPVVSATAASVPYIMTNHRTRNILCHLSLMRSSQFPGGGSSGTTQLHRLRKIGTTFKQLITSATKRKATRWVSGTSWSKINLMEIGDREKIFWCGGVPRRDPRG